MNNAVFENTTENVRKRKNDKLLKTERRINYLVSEPNYYTAKSFTENSLAIEMRKIKVLMNELFYLSL